MTNHISPVDKTEILAKAFNTVIANLQNLKQNYKKAKLVYDQLTNKKWQAKYRRWVNGENSIISNVADKRKDVGFDSIFNDEEFGEIMFMGLVCPPLWIIAPLIGVLQLLIEAPVVLASKLKPISKEEEALPLVKGLLNRITEIAPVKKDHRRDHIFRGSMNGAIYQDEYHNYKQAYSDEILQQMNDKIYALEQLRTSTLNQFTNQIDGPMENLDKKSKFIMPNHTSHLTGQQKGIDCDYGIYNNID